MPAINCVGDTLNISINTKPHTFLWLLALSACALPKDLKKSSDAGWAKSQRQRHAVIKAAALIEAVSSQGVSV